jgi:hypothetical protein
MPRQPDHAATNTVLTVETFDGFTYVAKIGAKKDDDYPVTFAISAKLPTERVAGKDEKPDEKTKLDKAFADEKTRLTEKLAKESQFTNWIYQLPAYSVDQILKTRSQLLEEPKKDESAKPATPAVK